MTAHFPPLDSSGSHDFDFLLGDWTVRHRRLTERLARAEQWLEFSGTMRAVPILAGQGNFDENSLMDPQGCYTASTVRIFDADARSWSIYWIDGRRMTLDPPLSGGFQDEIGLFYGHDDLRGSPIDIRFTWNSLSPEHARWEQAFAWRDSGDWEINWTMDFHRQAIFP